MTKTVRTLSPGATKEAPFTIVIIANPALEAPEGSSVFYKDPIIGRQPAFDFVAQYVFDCLMGRVPGQVENIFDDPAMAAAVRIVSIYDDALPVVDANSLVAQHGGSSLLVPRRSGTQAFVMTYGLVADVTFAISASETHKRASAYYTTDDDTLKGTSFTIDGAILHHRHYVTIPGTVALHETSTSLTPLHEFQHAISSYSNGMIIDLYVDNVPAINNKRGRPIPSSYGSYDAFQYQSDRNRDSLGYDPGWKSYHCELISQTEPCVMDDYFRAPNPIICRNDGITRRFVIDRIRAKMSR